MARLLVFLLATLGFLLGQNSISTAAQRTLNASTPTVKAVPTEKAAIPVQGKAADLTIRNAAWAKPPKGGDSVGGSPILNILVENKGNAPANGSALKIDCSALTKNNCPAAVSGSINIPSLGPGKTTMIAWPSLSSEKWAPGRFRLNIRADASNRIKESNEKNNAVQVGFTVIPNPQKKAGFIQRSSRGIEKKAIFSGHDASFCSNPASEHQDRCFPNPDTVPHPRHFPLLVHGYSQQGHRNDSCQCFGVQGVADNE